MIKERRKYPRVSLELPLKISHEEMYSVTETKNISGNGVYCAIDKNIELMTKLKIILMVPIIKERRKTIKKIYCEGVVVRKESNTNNGKRKYNIGVFFNHIKERDRKILIDYINSSL